MRIDTISPDILNGIASGAQPDLLSKTIPSGEGAGKSFGQFLTEALAEVNGSQQNANDIMSRFAEGQPIDIHQVMIAMEEASTSLALTVQVRNKIVEAYQQIMQTQV
jgi:flagellar hook-basal body complex protein FliE